MAVVHLTSQNFNDTVANNDIVIIDFWAEWCGPCRQYGPIFEKVSEKYPDIVFGKINTEEEQELAGYFGIQSIPTTIILREGIGIFMQPGIIPEEAFDDLITQVKNLDMDQVREEVAKQQAQAGE